MSKLSLLILIGILAQISARELIFSLTAHCPIPATWCMKQQIVEKDLIRDDYWKDDLRCENVLYMDSRFKLDHTSDGVLQNYFELEANVFHNCTMDGSIRKETLHLTEIDKERGSQSNQKHVEVVGPRIEIVYKVENILNSGLRVMGFDDPTAW